MNGDMAMADFATAAWDYGSAGILESEGTRERARPEPADGRFKRGLDIVFALLAGMLLLPAGALIALAVKLTSRGPVFFFQERAGLNGRPFRMIKFRSMVVDAEQRLQDLVKLDELAEPVYKLADDPRVTRVGRFLRRYGLDELPQVWNVLRGEMSLVGPRPEVVKLADRYNAEQRRRLLVKPGITGYQQIHNRGMPDMAARLAYDLYYLRNRTILLDLWILAMTVAVILSGEEITY